MPESVFSPPFKVAAPAHDVLCLGLDELLDQEVESFLGSDTSFTRPKLQVQLTVEETLRVLSLDVFVSYGKCQQSYKFSCSLYFPPTMGLFQISHFLMV